MVSLQQKVILVALGLQHTSVDQLAEIRIVPKLPPFPASQILGHFKRAMIKISESLQQIEQVIRIYFYYEMINFLYI